MIQVRIRVRMTGNGSVLMYYRNASGSTLDPICHLDIIQREQRGFRPYPLRRRL